MQVELEAYTLFGSLLSAQRPARRSVDTTRKHPGRCHRPAVMWAVQQSFLSLDARRTARPSHRHPAPQTSHTAPGQRNLDVDAPVCHAGRHGSFIVRLPPVAIISPHLCLRAARTVTLSNISNINWFRDAFPYINAHRDKTFVIEVPGDAIDHTNFDNLAADIALLSSLGVRVVLVHGASPQLARILTARQLPGVDLDNAIGATSDAQMTAALHGCAEARIHLEARLSMGVVNSPMKRAALTVASGNFVIARPLGVRDGIDCVHSGEVRKVNVDAITRQLGNGNVVLISPIGYSPSGEVFSLAAGTLALAVAQGIGADKLICLTADGGVFDDSGTLLGEVDTRTTGLTGAASRCQRACEAGVPRGHVISYGDNGALLTELFTRDGAGTQIVRESYEQIRVATTEDLPGIIELITPLEIAGVLVKRSRELLESEVDRFSVIDRDGMTVACAALYPFGDAAEVACVVTHPEYQGEQRGERILAHLERTAQNAGVNEVFVLTTQSAHWFIERGFATRDVSDLPAARKSLYNYQRKSKLFVKSLAGSALRKVP
jgi:amino-acid N-acetyltransferase